MGTEKFKLCTIGKKIFCTGSAGSAGQFFMLQLPSKIHRLSSVVTGNKPVEIFSNQSNNASVHKKGATIPVLYIYIFIFIFSIYVFCCTSYIKCRKR